MTAESIQQSIKEDDHRASSLNSSKTIKIDEPQEENKIIDEAGE